MTKILLLDTATALRQSAGNADAMRHAEMLERMAAELTIAENLTRDRRLSPMLETEETKP